MSDEGNMSNATSGEAPGTTSIVEQLREAALYNSWQNAELAKRTLYSLAADRIDALLSALDEALAYFEEREDVRDGGDGRQLANEEMHLAGLLREAMEKARKS